MVCSVNINQFIYSCKHLRSEFLQHVTNDIYKQKGVKLLLMIFATQQKKDGAMGNAVPRFIVKSAVSKL